MQEESLDSSSFTAASDNVIACTLTAADLQDRQNAWRKVGQYITASGPIAGGLRFVFAPTIGVQDSLAELVRLEAECCAWMAFAITDSSDGIRLSITASGQEGERAVRETFAPLMRSYCLPAPTLPQTGGRRRVT